MTKAVATVLMVNNYFHDLATAMIMATATVTWFIVDKVERAREAKNRLFYIRVYNLMAKIFFYTLIGLMLGSIPRILTFRIFELKEAQIKGQLLPLTAKLGIAFILVMAGSAIWIKITRRVKFFQKR
ncbi:MAG: hypothetical protein GXO99_04480 [Nitrospirae bacterium]|nr:hypothetical protein [Nitrospirota bacterium]